jgi:hypothetical protein
MAEERYETEQPTRTGPRPKRPARELSASGAAEAGLRHVAELTGKETSGVTSLQPAEDGWVVGVEVVEERRIPSSSDMLALYEAEIASDGDLLAYRRTGRYSRGRGDNRGAA